MRYAKFCTPFLSICCLLISSRTLCQLTVTPGIAAAALAAKLAGPGITITAPTLTCPAAANGTFISVSTPLTLDSGIILTTGKAIQASGPEAFLASTNDGAPGDPALAALALTPTLFDACTLQFDFIPNGDTVSFNYQFGSEEYNHSTCGPYNDAFAFFISGPGIAGTQNMALIPGTTIPVTVNSVNSGTPGAGYTLANCTAIGAGSPFTMYYYDNTGGARLSYKGFTTKLTASHSVIPCNTYHLKISICDAGNALYDSGVFIEAGSLKTNSYSFDRFDSIGSTIDGIPHTIVKGCSPAIVTVLTAHAANVPQTLHFAFGGTGVQGVDYTAPDSVIIPAGDSTIAVSVAGIPTIAGGSKTLELYLLSPFSCGIVDSIALNIMDTPTAFILTPDTTICSGTSFQIRTIGTAGLSYSWLPITGLTSSIAAEPIAFPSATTTYTMSATLPGAGCPAIVKDIAVTVINTTVSILTPDTTICSGGFVNMRVNGSPTLNYSWSPATGLSSPFVQNPIAAPIVTTTYTLTATAPGGRCPTTQIITITVETVNASILTPDTTICMGASFTVRVNGTTGPTYTWTPDAGLSSATDIQPVATPTVTTDYVLTASWPGSGCPDFTGHVLVTVLDATMTLLSHDTTICYGAYTDIQLSGSPGLAYSWSPATGLNSPFVPEPVASPSVTTTYTVTATSPGGVCSSQDTLTIAVGNPAVSILTNDTVICRGTLVPIRVSGDPSLDYNWSPALSLSDTNAREPVAHPAVTTTYIMKAGVGGAPCFVTDSLTISVSSTSLINVTVSQAIKYGSSVQLNADGALVYLWSPNDGSLSNANINDPIATPLAPTTYTVYGMNNFGCRDSASLTVSLIYDHIFIPEAFTPNNDGLNDMFHVGNLGYYKLAEMSVFNRWGIMVYHAMNENKGWDGTFNGVPQEMGAYNYFITISEPDGVLQNYKGNVTLIR